MNERKRRLLLIVAAFVGLATIGHVVHDGLEAQEADACAVCNVAHSPVADSGTETAPPVAPAIVEAQSDAQVQHFVRSVLLSAAPSRAPPA